MNGETTTQQDRVDPRSRPTREAPGNPWGPLWARARDGLAAAVHGTVFFALTLAGLLLVLLILGLALAGPGLLAYGVGQHHADAGLARALALDSPMRIRVISDLYGRPSAPIESAAYFAVSELLANVSKHAEARETWIDIRYTDGMLRIGVTDNGHGGADPSRGSGLRGIERRLAAFDGVMAISSPPGGPTAVTMEIPCELSSPKTSSC